MDSNKITTLPVERNGKPLQLMDAATRTLRSPPSPEWLSRWTPAEGAPMAADEIQTSLNSFREATAPSTRPQVSAALAAAVNLFGPPADHATKFPLYISLLEDIPPDLLAYGMFKAMQLGEFFPKPAQIRAPIREELARRHFVRMKLDVALSVARKAENEARLASGRSRDHDAVAGRRIADEWAQDRGFRDFDDAQSAGHTYADVIRSVIAETAERRRAS